MERPPPPGVGALTNLEGMRPDTDAGDQSGCPPPGASLGGLAGAAQKRQLPEHLQEPTDRRYALKHFEKQVLTQDADPAKVGYIVTIPLDPRRVSKSAVRNGALSPEKAQKHAKYYGENQRPAPVRRVNPETQGLRNLTDDDIEDDPRFEKAGSADSVPAMRPIPPYTSAGEGKTKRLINTPIDPEHPGEAKVGPGDWEASKEKQLYDTVRSTKLPWEKFKNPFKAAFWKTDRVEKLAGAVGLNLQPYAYGSVWSRSTPALLLDLIMLGHFGKEWISWEPDVVGETLVRGGLASPEEVASVFEKMMAVQALHACDIFWESWGAFEKIALALLGKDIDPQRWQPITIEDVARAVVIARGLPGLKSKVFSEEVLCGIAAKVTDNHRPAAPGVPHPAESLIHVDGLVYLPPPLDAAQPYLEQLLPESGRALAAQVKFAYANRWPVTNGEDALNIQLDKLLRLAAYIAAP